MKINKAIELITAAIPGAPFDDTVDVIKTGDASQEITSVVVTFMATVEVALISSSLMNLSSITISTRPSG
jgi:hypothetical protein